MALERGLCFFHTYVRHSPIPRQFAPRPSSFIPSTDDRHLASRYPGKKKTHTIHTNYRSPFFPIFLFLPAATFLLLGSRPSVLVQLDRKVHITSDPPSRRRTPCSRTSHLLEFNHFVTDLPPRHPFISYNQDFISLFLIKTLCLLFILGNTQSYQAASSSSFKRTSQPPPCSTANTSQRTNQSVPSKSSLSFQPHPILSTCSSTPIQTSTQRLLHHFHPVQPRIPAATSVNVGVWIRR